METSALFTYALFASLGLIALWHIHRSYPSPKLVISIQTFNQMPFEHFTELPRVATEPRSLTVLHPEYLEKNYHEVQELPCYKEWNGTPVLSMRTFFLFALQNISLIFIGDSRINHLFFTLRAMLLPYEYPVQTRPRVGECESHLDIRSHNSSIHYYRSRLPDKGLADVLTMIHSNKHWQLRRTYVLYECGAWPLYVNQHNVLEDFRRNMSWAAQIFSRFPRSNIVPIWIRTIAMHSDPAARNRETFWTDHLNDTEVWIERIGEELTKAANKEGMFVWQSAYDITLHEPALYKDIVHPGTMLNRKILTLLFCSMAGESIKKKNTF